MVRHGTKICQRPGSVRGESKEESQEFMKKLHTYIGHYWYGYLFAICSMIIATGLDMVYPQITQRIVDEVIIGGKMEMLTGLLVGIVAVGIGRCIFGYCKEFSFDVLSSKIGAQIRKDLFRHIQTLSMNYFDNTNTGELMARVKDDVDKIQNALGYVGMLLIEVTIHVVFVLYCMFSLNWKMAFLPVTVMLCCAVVAIIMERKLDKVYEDISEENAVLTTVAEENLAGVRTVKAFAREDYEIKKFLSHNERYYNLNITQSKVLVRYYPLFQFVGKVLPVAITILGGISVMNGNMSLGALVAYAEYSRNCTWPMEMMGWLTNDLSSAVASYKKIKKIYEVKPEIQDSRNVVTLDHVSGNVEFDHVSFKLDGKQILSDISFSVKEGKTLGIMGATGSGKSSIINMLHRFYDTTEGSVRLDGVDIRKYGSQGQQRTSALSLKLSEISLVKKNINSTPVLLLDDVLSELDGNRQNYLLNSLSDTQTIITCTGLDEFVKNRFQVDKVFHVVKGQVEVIDE